MTYLIRDIAICLAVAGLIGAIIGWWLRGGSARKEKKRLKKELGEVRTLHEGAKRDVEAANVKVAEMKARANAAAKLEERVVSLEADKTSFGKQRLEFERQVADLAKNRDLLQSQVEDAKAKAQAAVEERNRIAEDAKTTQKPRPSTASAAMLASERTSHGKTKRELEQLRKEIAAMREQYGSSGETDARYQQAKTENSDLRAQIHEQARARETLAAKIAKLEAELKAAGGGDAGDRATIEALEATVGELEGKLQGAIDSNAKLTADLSALQAKAGSADSGARPAVLMTAPVGKADNLKRISGVGPVLEKLLNDLGLFHYRQIASFTPEDVAWVDSRMADFKGRIQRDDWVGQAKRFEAERDES